jgi:hypothetical protein
MSDKHQMLHTISASLSQVIHSSVFLLSFIKSTRLILFCILTQNVPPTYFLFFSYLIAPRREPDACLRTFGRGHRNPFFGHHQHSEQGIGEPRLPGDIKLSENWRRGETWRENLRCSACSFVGGARMCIEVPLQESSKKHLLRFA